MSGWRSTVGLDGRVGARRRWSVEGGREASTPRSWSGAGARRAVVRRASHRRTRRGRPRVIVRFSAGPSPRPRDGASRGPGAHQRERRAVYRYRASDGLEGEEGAFSICTFWLAHALALTGDYERADLIVRRMLRHANHVGLFSEEIDPKTGEFLGNFPQGFTHIALINCAVALAQAERSGGPAGKRSAPRERALKACSAASARLFFFAAFLRAGRLAARFLAAFFAGPPLRGRRPASSPRASWRPSSGRASLRPSSWDRPWLSSSRRVCDRLTEAAGRDAAGAAAGWAREAASAQARPAAATDPSAEPDQPISGVQRGHKCFLHR